jgi:2-keto-3-deoxy-6-phosphogluconate aldolase
VSPGPAQGPPLGYEICISGAIDPDFLSAYLQLESRQSSAGTVLRIETEDDAAEVVAQFLARGRHVISIRLVA